jgi:hypothetical protein
MEKTASFSKKDGGYSIIKLKRANNYNTIRMENNQQAHSKLPSIVQPLFN